MDAEQTEGNDPAVLPLGPFEKLCYLLCALSLLAMVVIVAVEVITRNLMGFSFEVSDELGGYIIVLISFLSLSVCQVRQSYHHVEFLQRRLSPRAQAVSRVVFDAICLALCLMLWWQLFRLAWNSWDAEDVAATQLMTPLWMPQGLMAFGMAALCVSVARTLWAHVKAVP